MSADVFKKDGIYLTHTHRPGRRITVRRRQNAHSEPGLYGGLTIVEAFYSRECLPNQTSQESEPNHSKPYQITSWLVES